MTKTTTFLKIFTEIFLNRNPKRFSDTVCHVTLSHRAGQDASRPLTPLPISTEAPTQTNADTVTEASLEQKPKTDSALAMSKPDSSSAAALEKERSDLAKKLTVPLLIILAVLIVALIIVTVWIKNRMKKK